MARHARYNRAARLAAPAVVRKQASARASRRAVAAGPRGMFRRRQERNGLTQLQRLLTFAREYAALDEADRANLERIIDLDSDEDIDGMLRYHEMTLDDVVELEHQLEDSMMAFPALEDQIMMVDQYLESLEFDARDAVDQDNELYSQMSRRRR